MQLFHCWTMLETVGARIARLYGLDQKQQMHMVGHDRVFFQMHHFSCNHIPANGLALLYDTACRSPNIKILIYFTHPARLPGAPCFLQ